MRVDGGMDGRPQGVARADRSRDPSGSLLTRTATAVPVAFTMDGSVFGSDVGDIRLCGPDERDLDGQHAEGFLFGAVDAADVGELLVTWAVGG